MKCPTCTTDLLISHRHNVEIDYCPTCRGVWLDRGELDKIVERCSRFESHDRDDDDDDRRHPSHDPRYATQHPPKRKSFWSELFD